MRHRSGKELWFENELDLEDAPKSAQGAFKDDSSFLICSWKEVKAKMNKKFKAQAKTARIKAGLPPTAAERCADGPIEDLKKKKASADLLFHKLNQVEIEEEGGVFGSKSNAAVTPTGAASKYAVDDGPHLTSSQMAAKRKADAAAKAAAESDDYGYDDEYDEGYYSEDEAAEPQTELLPEDDIL